MAALRLWRMGCVDGAATKRQSDSQGAGTLGKFRVRSWFLLRKISQKLILNSQFFLQTLLSRCTTVFCTKQSSSNMLLDFERVRRKEKECIGVKLS